MINLGGGEGEGDTLPLVLIEPGDVVGCSIARHSHIVIVEYGEESVLKAIIGWCLDIKYCLLTGQLLGQLHLSVPHTKGDILTLSHLPIQSLNRFEDMA